VVVWRWRGFGGCLGGSGDVVEYGTVEEGGGVVDDGGGGRKESMLGTTVMGRWAVGGEILFYS